MLVDRPMLKSSQSNLRQSYRLTVELRRTIETTLSVLVFDHIAVLSINMVYLIISASAVALKIC